MEVMKKDASCDLVAEDMTKLMIWARVRSGMLLDGMGTSLERNIWAPDWLQGLISLRKDASEVPARTMLLVH